MDTVSALATRWREAAEMLRQYGALEAAATCELHAGELETALRAAAAEELTLREASRESGYSARRLREMLSEGTIPQAGRRGAPRIRRGDLPRRARRNGAGSGGYNPAVDAQALAGRLGGG